MSDAGTPAGGGSHALFAKALAGAGTHTGGAGILPGAVSIQGAALRGGNGLHTPHALRPLLLAAGLCWCVFPWGLGQGIVQRIP